MDPHDRPTGELLDYLDRCRQAVELLPPYADFALAALAVEIEALTAILAGRSR